MKSLIISIIAAVMATTPVFSQITVDQSDMPAAGDTLRMSVTNFVPPGYERTAMDTAWDFSALQALNQRVDTFMNATSAPSAYQFFFVLLGGANLASPMTPIPVPGLPVSQGFTFYKNSAASFSDLGSAYTIQGLPLPAKYDTPDKVYQFPMVPGLQWNSVSEFEITVPELAYYSTRRVRSNIVDGWGTVTTPLGTFQTLRIKSTLAVHDSVFLYIDSLGTGFPVDRNIIEYKWLAKGEGVPVMQISEEGNVATATYRDIYRMPAQALNVSLGPDTAVFKGTVLTMHANVAGGTPPYRILWNTLDTGNTLTVTVQDIQNYSVFVVDAIQNVGMAQKLVSIRYPQGLENKVLPLLRPYPDPARDKVHFTLAGKSDRAVLYVINPMGKEIHKKDIFRDAGVFTADISGLPPGFYLIRVFTDTQEYSAKLRIAR